MAAGGARRKKFSGFLKLRAGLGFFVSVFADLLCGCLYRLCPSLRSDQTALRFLGLGGEAVILPGRLQERREAQSTPPVRKMLMIFRTRGALGRVTGLPV